MILFWLNDGVFSKPHSHLSRLLARQLSSCVLFVVGCFVIQYGDLSSFFSSKTPMRHAGQGARGVEGNVARKGLQTEHYQ